MVEATSFSHGPASSVPPPKRRGCLSWPVLIAAGCLTLIVGAVLLVGLVVLLLQTAVKSSDAYTASLNAARASSAVREDFGEPLTPSWWVSGSVSVDNDIGSADLQYRIAGPKAQGMVTVQGTRTAGVWTYTVLTVRRDDGKTYQLSGGSGTSSVDGAGQNASERLIEQPLPEFLKGSQASGSPARAATTTLPPAPTAVRLTPVDASAAQTEAVFMAALLNNKPEQALASASNSFLLEGGIEVLKSFGELAQERGGGTFTPAKTAQLEDGHSAVVGEVVFGDGTKMKVTVLTLAGKVEGFTSVP